MHKALQEAIGDVLATFPEMDFVEAIEFCKHNLYIPVEETDDDADL